MADEQTTFSSERIKHTVFEILDAIPPATEFSPFRTAENLALICKTDFPNMIGLNLVEHVIAWYKQNGRLPCATYGDLVKTQQLLSLCERTFASLDRALSEGYENVLSNSPAETAAEIGEYDATLAEVPRGTMVQLITLWLTSQTQYGSTTELVVRTLNGIPPEARQRGAAQIAMDLATYSPQFKGVAPESLVPHVRYWLLTSK